MEQGIPSVLYRWITNDDIKHFAKGLKPMPAESIGVPGHPDVSAWIDVGEYTIAPRGKDMTVEDYLSPGMGVGGNVIGFFEYIENWSSAKKQGRPGYNDMSTTKIYFGRGRHLLIVPMARYDGPPILYAGAALRDTITTCPGYLKIAKLGSLMETRGSYGQDAEWNFIPGQLIALPAVIVQFGKFVGDEFERDASVETQIDSNKLLKVIRNLVETELIGKAPPISGTINIDQCPSAKGGKRRTRKRTTRRKRTYRNILPKVVGS